MKELILDLILVLIILLFLVISMKYINEGYEKDKRVHNKEGERNK